MSGVVVPPGQGRKLVTKAQEVTFKVTGADGAFASCFEVVVPPGFDVGAHTHHQSQEFFYVLDGELELFAFEPLERTGDRWQDWKSAAGDRPLRAGPGSCMFVPAGCPHAFTNPTDEPVRMLFQSAPPPDHERYFEEICEIFSSGRTVDSDAVQRLRDRYGLTQLTPLRYGPAPEDGGRR
jgi:mannose-6-phosphate isomerase-like protein (cupin superfamily)